MLIILGFIVFSIGFTGEFMDENPKIVVILQELNIEHRSFKNH